MKKLLGILFFAVCFVSAVNAQRTVSGTITDAAGEPLIGANVLVTGTTLGTITDIDGGFSMEVPADANSVTVSYTGYETKDVSINGLSNVSISLSEGTLLDVLVIQGYGTAKKSNMVSSISTVDGEVLTRTPIASVDNLLQGRSTGVEVTAINGKPGQNGYMRIRGLTSINGNNDPLFIVDGVPVPRAVYAAINPNDIEEFSILKDASATAIYGARASAGVVIVQTKKGTANNSVVEYSYQIGRKTLVDDGFTLMNGDQKLDYEIALGIRDVMSVEERADLLQYQTDWEDELIRDGKLNQHNLAFSGGGEKGSYYLGLSRYDEQGMALGSDFDRTTVKLNNDYKVNNWIKVTNNISVSRRNDTELRDRYNVQSPFYGRYAYNPYETVFALDDNGEVQFDALGEPIYNFTSQGFNIVEAIQNNPESRRWTDVYGSLRFDFNPIENLTISSQGGYNFNTFKGDYFIKPGSILDGYVGNPDSPGIKRNNGNERDRYIWTNTAQYNFDLDDSNGLTALVGTEFVKDNIESYSVEGIGFPVGLSVLDVAAEINDGFTRKNEFALYSTFGRLDYSRDNNLNVSLSVRRDGSSRFGSGLRFGTFWAIGAGYDFSRSLLADMDIFDQLKLRASYGTTGNEPANLYDPLGVIEFTSYDDQTASFQGNVANPLLQWESQKSLSFGVDFGIFNNRVTGSVEYFNKLTQDLLFPDQLSRTTGFSTITSNIGDMSNKGIEVEAYYSPIRSQKRDGLNVEFGVRYSNVKTVMEKLNTDEQIDPANAFISILKQGEAAYTYELVDYVGVDTETGDLLYLDAEGNETTAPTASDAKLQGKSPLPTFFGGFDVNVDFKGFALNTSFSFKGGNYIYNIRKRDLLSGIDGARRQQSVEASDYWQNPGDVTEIPRPGVEVEPTASTRFLEKGDYVRLRNVQLSYTLPTRIVSKAKIAGLSFFVSGTNLLTFTNFQGDPEVGVLLEESVSNVGRQVPGEYSGYSYPNNKSFTGGFNVRF